MFIPKVMKFSFLGAIAAAMLGGCATVRDYVKEPQVDLRDVRVTAMLLADATVAFDLDVKNPNPVGLSMKGLSYHLQLEDETLFRGSVQEKLRIGANDTSRLSLPFTLSYNDIVGSVQALRGNKEIKYRIAGDADFGLISVPYEKTGTLPVPSIPDVSLQSLSVERLSFNGADLMLGLKVKNANSFPIRFNGLDYQLKLGNASVLKGRSTQAFSVDQNQTGTLRLPISLDYGRVAELAQSLRQGSSLPVAFDANVKVPGGKGDINLPYAWNGNVPLFR